jgi:hypothetical protein
LSKVPDVLASIAVAKYRKHATSTSELREAFKRAVKANKNSMEAVVEQENHVRMEYDVGTFVKAKKDLRKESEAYLGGKLPKTMNEFLEWVQGTAVYGMEMLMRYNNYAYELEAKCTPFLVRKLRAGVIGGKNGPVMVSDVDLAFSECAGFLDAVFVGGMGCERMLSPHPLRSKSSIHEIVVNVSKARVELTERLQESIGHATKEILIVGVVRSFHHS